MKLVLNSKLFFVENYLRCYVQKKLIKNKPIRNIFIEGIQHRMCLPISPLILTIQLPFVRYNKRWDPHMPSKGWRRVETRQGSANINLPTLV